MLPVYEIRKTDLTVKRNNYELNYPEHMHKYVEVVYTHKGVQHLRIESNSYEINEGCAGLFSRTQFIPIIVWTKKSRIY